MSGSAWYLRFGGTCWFDISAEYSLPRNQGIPVLLQTKHENEGEGVGPVPSHPVTKTEHTLTSWKSLCSPTSRLGPSWWAVPVSVWTAGLALMVGSHELCHLGVCFIGSALVCFFVRDLLISFLVFRGCRSLRSRLSAATRLGPASRWPLSSSNCYRRHPAPTITAHLLHHHISLAHVAPDRLEL